MTSKVLWRTAPSSGGAVFVWAALDQRWHSNIGELHVTLPLRATCLERACGSNRIERAYSGALVHHVQAASSHPLSSPSKKQLPIPILTSYSHRVVTNSLPLHTPHLTSCSCTPVSPSELANRAAFASFSTVQASNGEHRGKRTSPTDARDVLCTTWSICI